MIRLSVDLELRRPFIFFLPQEESSKQASFFFRSTRRKFKTSCDKKGKRISSKYFKDIINYKRNTEKSLAREARQFLG